jgi:predicted nucleic acid-binding protein
MRKQRRASPSSIGWWRKARSCPPCGASKCSTVFVAVRRGRITTAYRDASLNDLRSLVIAIDPGTNRQAWSATLRLFDRFGLTPYDAAYLELAQRRHLPLATLDGELIRAAQTVNVPLVGAT